MKRISVNVEEDLHTRLRVVAATEDYTLREIVVGLLTSWVEKKEVEIRERVRRPDEAAE